MRRSIVAGVVVLSVVALPVAAHMNSGRSTVYVAESSSAAPACGTSQAEFGDGYGGELKFGQIKMSMAARLSTSATSQCDKAWIRPKGWLATNAIIWKKRPQGRVAICKDFGLWHSVKPQSDYSWQQTYADRAPCGRGVYAVLSRGHVKLDSGQWASSPWVETADHKL